MKYLKSVFAMCLAAAMTSCSSDEPAVSGGEDPGAKDGFYATVSFKMPTGSRAEGPNGTEEGQTYENNISSILVILAEQTAAGPYNYVSYAYSDAPLFAGGSTTNEYTINFQDKENLFAYAGDGGKKVNVFAYCNAPSSLVTYVEGLASATDKTFTDQMLTTNAASTWASNSFLMTSAKLHSVTLPSQTTLKTYNTATNAFNLTESGPIEVLRTAVRFDFKDGAPDPTNAPLTYTIKDISDNTKNQGTVTLTRAALFNLRDQFYYLPRVAAADGTETLCPDDMESGHMVSPAADRTFSEAITFEAVDGASLTEYDPSINGSLNWATLSAVLGLTEDIDVGWNLPTGATGTKDGYHIWRYATENTYAYNATSFPRKDATGIVFEAEIKLDATKFPGVTVGTEPMYLYQGTLYPNAKQVYEAAKKYPGSSLAENFEKVFDVTTVGDNTTVTIKPAHAAALQAEGFTIYRPKSGKYYCYYYYFNRHNDNGKPETTTPFEFATVRNNVYKLSVTNIKQFGTFVPPTTVEDWDVYFSLDVQIRPWTVRVNNIEF